MTEPSKTPAADPAVNADAGSDPSAPAPQPRAVATARTPGFDVARALAILGMVIVNFRSIMEVPEEGPPWLVWMADRLEGRAAALFVVLAGVGISLRSRRARHDPAEHMSFERVALMKRAAVLLFAGFLNLHLWEWDILHCYALFLAIAALLLNAPGWLLWVLSAACMGGQLWLEKLFDYEADVDLWSGTGALWDLFFNGNHPVFPWVTFLLVGMWVGRMDLKDAVIRRQVLATSLALMFVGELVDTIALRSPDSFGLDFDTMTYALAWPRPPRPLYVVTAAATSIAAICIAISVTEPRPRSLWVVSLTATGQLAFTLYIAHAVAVVIPMMHGLFDEATLAVSVAYSLTFYAVAVAFSLWWRRRFPQGPLEALIRQVTGRTTPAPWGGQLAGAPKE